MNRLLMLVICSVLSSAWAGNCIAEAAPPASSAAAPDAYPPALAGAVPSDAQLQSMGARIGRIDFHIDEVFDDASLSAPYRVANALHIMTQQTALRAQLLFKSGDAFDRRVLDETERALRQRRYLSEAEIEPVCYHEDGTVDVLVRVRDVWTLMPGLSFGRKGGTNSTKIEIEDSNLLGLGKEISLERSTDVDRDTTRLRYRDPNVWGSRWKLEAAYLDSSDGVGQSLELARPFYALDSRWSFHLAATDVSEAVSRYSLGNVVDQFDQRTTGFDVGGGISTGLHDGWVRRLLSGIHYERHEFAVQPPQPLVSVPQDRTMAYPWIGVELIEDVYRTARNLDQIGRTEDLFLGRSARLEVGWASDALGATRNALVTRGILQAGAQISDTHFVSNVLEFRGRFESGGLRDGLVDFTSRYHLRQSPSRVLYGSVNVAFASNLDPEQQLLLGGDNGLRGFPLRYQAGTARALMTLEQRFYTKTQLFKLLNVGSAIFFDAGRVFGKDATAAAPLGWLADVGVGLRLGSARSGLGNVLHIDLAYPLNGPRDLDQLQFLIGTHRSF